jgi:hypothetical protein
MFFFVFFFYFLGVGWDWVHLVRRPIFSPNTSPDDRWWVWSSRWNENWQGKPKYSEKTCPSTTLSTTNPTWSDLGSNLGHRYGKPATNRLSYGTTEFGCYLVWVSANFDYPGWWKCRSQWPRAKAWNVFARLNTGILGSNPARVMDVCLRLLYVCVVLCK